MAPPELGEFGLRVIWVTQKRLDPVYLQPCFDRGTSQWKRCIWQLSIRFCVQCSDENTRVNPSTANGKAHWRRDPKSTFWLAVAISAEVIPTGGSEITGLAKIRLVFFLGGGVGGTGGRSKLLSDHNGVLRKAFVSSLLPFSAILQYWEWQKWPVRTLEDSCILQLHAVGCVLAVKVLQEEEESSMCIPSCDSVHWCAKNWTTSNMYRAFLKNVTMCVHAQWMEDVKWKVSVHCARNASMLHHFKLEINCVHSISKK